MEEEWWVGWLAGCIVCEWVFVAETGDCFLDLGIFIGMDCDGFASLCFWERCLDVRCAGR